MLISYTCCVVIKKPNNSKEASEYWAAKARETEVDTTAGIVGYSILGALFGIPIAALLLAGLCFGIYYPFFKLSEKFEERGKKQQKSDECAYQQTQEKKNVAG